MRLFSQTIMELGNLEIFSRITDEKGHKQTEKQNVQLWQIDLRDLDEFTTEHRNGSMVYYSG